MVSRFILIMAVVLLAACASGPQPAPPAEVSKTSPPPVPADQGTESAASLLLADARAARRAGDYSDAAVLLQRAQRIDSRDARIYLEYASLYRDQGQLEEARAMAERGLGYCDGSVCRALREFTD